MSKMQTLLFTVLLAGVYFFFALFFQIAVANTRESSTHPYKFLYTPSPTGESGDEKNLLELVLHAQPSHPES